jgi:iron complex transport system substrate-binding protein
MTRRILAARPALVFCFVVCAVFSPSSRVPPFALCPWPLAPAQATGRGPQAPGENSQRPARIISLVPAVTEMLFAIGAGDRVVGVSSYDRYPPEAATRPKVGALIDPDFERIISLTPDLVIVYGTQNELIERLGRVRIPVFHYQHRGLADVLTTIVALGERVGRTAEAKRESARIQRELDEVRAQVAGAPPVRTLLVFGRELGSLRGIFASGGFGFMHDMLTLAGGVNVFEDVKRQSLQVTIETLLSRAPDLIIETYSNEGWTPARIEQERLLWRGLPTVPAVRTGRVHIMADYVLLVPGPRVGAAVRTFARIIHPSR